MKYTANPVTVDAFVIVSVAEKANADCSLNIALDNGDNYVATSVMMSRYVPSAGDYFVRQADGYEYLNPKDVFERKYHAANRRRPTIEELDKILNSEDDRTVKINPDGSITVE